MMAYQGYIHSIDNDVSSFRNLDSFNRFQVLFTSENAEFSFSSIQSEKYWPTKGWVPNKSCYAIYLIKRSSSSKVI